MADRQLEVLEKCAALLNVQAADLGDKVNLVVTAANEEMRVGQLFMSPLGRRVIVGPLTREEFDIARRYNAAVREQCQRPDFRYVAQGERPDSLRDTGQRGVGDPSPDCDRYYLCRALE